MAATEPASAWTPAVIRFLKANLPRLEDGSGWEHMHASAYQIGCEALAALGAAEETPWGAVPRKPARQPDQPPRWDDVCVAVLGLAAQQGKLSYRMADGSVPKRAGGDYILVSKGAVPLPAPNISAAHDLGPAHAGPDVLVVMRALGLLAGGKWAAAAETVLWREHPGAWDLDFQADARFVAAVEQAVQALPPEIAAKIDRLVRITDADVDAAVLASAEGHARMRAAFGPLARISPPQSPKSARERLVFQCRNDLDWLFFRHWRLADGWLTQGRPLEVFHDPLAIAMRRAVISRLYPKLPQMAER